MQQSKNLYTVRKQETFYHGRLYSSMIVTAEASVIPTSPDLHPKPCQNNTILIPNGLPKQLTQKPSPNPLSLGMIRSNGCVLVICVDLVRLHELVKLRLCIFHRPVAVYLSIHVQVFCLLNTLLLLLHSLHIAERIVGMTMVQRSVCLAEARRTHPATEDSRLGPRRTILGRKITTRCAYV